MADGGRRAEAAEGWGPTAAWDTLIREALETALESLEARDLRGTVEAIGLAIRALEQRARRA